MTFLAPAALGLLLLAGLILWLHVQRHRVRRIPSLHVWRMLTPEASKRTPVLSWPRPSWLLALQLLALALIALALAQPLFGAGNAPDHEIYVLDASGSMQAADGEASRFEHAVAALRERVAQAPTGAGGRLSLIVAGAPTEILVARQQAADDPLAAPISTLAPGDGAADWNRAADLASAILGEAETARLVVLTDGSDAGGEAIAQRFAGRDVQVIGFGSPVANTALAGTLTAPAEEDGPFMLQGSVAFTGEVDRTTVIVAVQPPGAEAPLDWARQQVLRPASGVEDGATATFRIELDLPQGARVTARVADDGAPFDNTLYFLVSGEAQPRDILYVGPGEQPLLDALQAVEGVRLFNAPDLPDDISQFALVVVDDVAVSRRPEASTLWIGAARVAGEAEPARGANSDPVYWNEGHVLADGVDWAALTVGEAVTLQPTGGETVVLAAESGPLLVAGDNEWGREVRLGFDPAASNWPRQTSFPAFAQNLLDWLGGAGGVVTPDCIAGVRCAVDVRLIGGTVAPLEAPPDAAPQALGDGFVPARAGFYALEKDGRSEIIAVNRPEGQEAALAPLAAGAQAGLVERLWQLAPWLLGAAFIVLLAEAWLAGRGPERFLRASGYARSNPLAARHRWLLGLRLVTLGLLGVSLFNVVLRTPEQVENVVALAPAGWSDPAVPPGGRLAVVRVGEAGGVVRDLGVDGDSTALSGGSAVSAADALAVATAMLPDGQSGHILVAGGPVVAGLADASAPVGTRIDLLPDPAPRAPDISVEMVEAPPSVYTGDGFTLAARVSSSEALSAGLTVSAAGAVLVEQAVDLRPGDNRIEIPVAAAPETETLYEIAIAADDDPTPQNNANGTIVIPARAGRLAVVTPQAEAGAALAGMLEPAGFTAEVLEPRRAPWTLGEWLDYDAVVLMNVPALDLGTVQQELIEQAVGEYGRGLLLFGGENSFGPGGYLETPLERLSPLSSKVPREAPQAAMMFVLDRSGSMNQAVGNTTRLDIAKRSTISAVGLLNPQSQVGIVVFDSEARTLVPMGPLSIPVVEDAMTNLDSAGGTSIYPGLVLAFDQLRQVEAPTKHVVIMTDGLTKPGDFAGILAQMRAQGITVSTVAIGEGADIGPLRVIAENGGGAFHSTRDFEALPSILSQEAMLLSGDPIEERAAAPMWRDRRAPFLAGLPDRLPNVYGYVLTTAKPEAELHLAVADAEGEEMPLMASWRYGNGQVLALTSHGAGRWTRDWLERPEVGLLWSQTIRHVLPHDTNRRLDLDLMRRGDRLDIVLDAQDAAGLPEAGLAPMAAITLDGAPLRDVVLGQTGPGRYTASVPALAAGTYRVTATAADNSADGAFYVAFPPALRHDDAGPGLAALAMSSGGTVLGEGESPFTGGDTVWTPFLWWPHWAGLALLVFFVDLLSRYGPSWMRLGTRRAARPAA